jgi:hypothetical protein
LGLAASLVAVLTLAGTSRADPTKNECIDADAKAQDLKRDHKLTAARDQLVICSSPACPGLVRADCASRLAGVEAILPSMVFDVVDPAGARLSGVTMTIDGVNFTPPDGTTTVALDPGSHTIVFHTPTNQDVTKTVVAGEGERGMHSRVEMGPPIVAAPAPVVAVKASDSGGGLGTQRVLGIVAAGAGLTGIVVGSIFGAMALSAKSAVIGDCGATCTPSQLPQAQSDHSSGITDSTISTIGFIAGGALLAGGAVLFFTGGTPASKPTTGSLTVVPSVGPGTGQMLVVGRF